MGKRNDQQQDDQEQGQQDQDVQVMKTADGSTFVQTGPDSVQINGHLHGGIHQTFN